MFDWKNFWDKYPERAEKDDYLKQVGKTVKSVAINDMQFDVMMKSIYSLLEINKNDSVLDLCCGNGIITKEIGKRCKYVLGIDFSKPLIETAKEKNKLKNIEYIQMDVKKLKKIEDIYKGKFTKILCYEAIMYLNVIEFEEMLKSILKMSVEYPIIMIGGIPEKKRKWNYFNTLKKKLFYFTYFLLQRRDNGIGRWWKAGEIFRVCRKYGMKAETVCQNKFSYASHYRFDIKILKKT